MKKKKKKKKKYKNLFSVILKFKKKKKKKKNPKSHLAVYILSKGRKTHKLFFCNLKKNFANITCGKVPKTVKVTWVKSSKLQKTALLEKCLESLPLHFSSFNAG